ncbi:MAG: hypothetical protein DCF29_11750 [Alphaproteobacteria bacterium]|nr:MAG: hypothetical protein DCF29_11750 [Alphaproteobacteria bacterium]
MKISTASAIILALALTPAVTACASQDRSGYVSPARFQTFDCNRMGAELVKVEAHYQQASDDYREYSQSFGLRLAASLVTFPLHQRLPSDGNEKLQRLDRLKAETDVLRGIAAERGCGVPERAR